MDGDIEELQGLMKKNLALSQETNDIVRGMRSAARWSMFFRILFWVIVAFASGSVYYLYLQPYMATIEGAYGKVQESTQQVQSIRSQVEGFLKTTAPATTTSSTSRQQ